MVKTVIDSADAASVLELGVWRGEFAAELLRDCTGIESYWMLDPWRRLEGWNKPFNVGDTQFEAAYEAAMAATDFAGSKRRVLRGTTLEMIGEIPDGSLDLAYVDGDHTLRGVALDFLSVWPKLRDGGLLLGDDFSPSVWQHGPFYEPSAVFPFAVYFAEAQNCPAIALSRNQVAIRKSPGVFQFVDPAGRYPRTDLLPQLSPIRQAESLARRGARWLLGRG